MGEEGRVGGGGTEGKGGVGPGRDGEGRGEWRRREGRGTEGMGWRRGGRVLGQVVRAREAGLTFGERCGEARGSMESSFVDGLG